MEMVGRMAELIVCVVCMTLIPVKNVQKEQEKQKENYVTVQAEMFCAKTRREGKITKEEYGKFCEAMSITYPEYDFDIVVARRYVMPLKGMDGSGDVDMEQKMSSGGNMGQWVGGNLMENGVHVKIKQRAEMEEWLEQEGEIIFDGKDYIHISVYGKEQFFYTCGGEVWRQR